LLEKQPAVGRTEDEGREGSVQETFVDVLHEVAWSLCVDISASDRQRKKLRDIQVFLSIAPIALSCSSTRIHLSSISLDCSASYPERSMLASTALAARTAEDSTAMVATGL
jgi:hypothetical protein